jgi:ketosteroid isomerase-like protein
MKKIVMILVGLVVLTCTVRAGNTANDQEFKKLIADYYEAWNTMKASNANYLYAQDANLVFYDIAPLKYMGWSEYRDGAQKLFFDTATTAKLTPNDDLKVTRHGDVAWTTLSFHLSANLKDGNKVDLDGRQTSIWEKRSGKWLIVHDHISTPLAMGPPSSPAN